MACVATVACRASCVVCGWCGCWQGDASEYAFDHVKKIRERIHDITNRTLKAQYQVCMHGFDFLGAFTADW